MTPREAAEASVPFNYAPSTPRERIEEDWAVRFPLAATNEGYLAQATGTSQWDGYDRLDRITAPTLVLHGELDALVPPANGRILADRIPGAELVMVPDGEPPARDRPAGAGLRAARRLAGSPPLNGAPYEGDREVRVWTTSGEVPGRRDGGSARCVGVHHPRLDREPRLRRSAGGGASRLRVCNFTTFQDSVIGHDIGVRGSKCRRSSPAREESPWDTQEPSGGSVRRG